MLPVVPDFTHLAGPPNFMQAGAFDDDWVNLLFVGRIIPNKRIEDVIRWFHAYKRWFNPRSRLLLVGSQGGFERYVAMLHAVHRRHPAPPTCTFSGTSRTRSSPPTTSVADVFLCASEHEGFCVPLIEAFHMGVPVLAYAAAAVPATMDGGGRARTATRIRVRVAALIHAIVDRPALQDRIVAGQDAALERLEAQDFGGTLLRFVDQVRQAPPRAASAESAFDFWDQVAPRRTSSKQMSARVPARRQYRRHLPDRPRTGQTAAEPDGTRARSHDRQPMGAGRAQGRCDRRQRAPRAGAAARARVTSRTSLR